MKKLNIGVISISLLLVGCSVAKKTDYTICKLSNPGYYAEVEINSHEGKIITVKETTRQLNQQELSEDEMRQTVEATKEQYLGFNGIDVELKFEEDIIDFKSIKYIDKGEIDDFPEYVQESVRWLKNNTSEAYIEALENDGYSCELAAQ